MPTDGHGRQTAEAPTALHGRDERDGRVRLLAVWEGGSRTAVVPPGGSVTVGRSRDCELVIDHPSISRRHVTIFDGSPVVLEDLGSSNGTRVDGAAVTAGRRTPITDKSVVELGACLMMVQPGRAPQDVGGAPAMARVDRLLEIVAKGEISVLFLGETGVGKDVAAQRVHDGSPRASRPLVRLNCAALPETLLESELFGYERGAFSGAAAAKPGLLETAQGGTLFLDEIGEMALPLQAKLLRVIESREVMRLGSTAPRKIDVRFLSATNRDLNALAAAGQFRADLYYRINGITVAIPPLRERRDEILPLAERFLREAAGARGGALRLSPEARRALVGHSWPGNIRELKNAVERAALLASEETVRPADLQLDAAHAPASEALDLRAEVTDAAKRAIIEALDRASGNQTEAAKLLGISRRALIYRLEDLGLPRPRKGRSTTG